MESPMAAMLDGSGGEAALAGWATSPARTTTSVTTTMRATRPIASPYCSKPRRPGQSGLPAGLRCHRTGSCQPLGCGGRPVLSRGIDVAEHDPHHVVRRMGALVHAVQPHDFALADHGNGITGTGRHLLHAVHIGRIQR